tara:strand:+ start:373 stop:693 length:321 start_codon:yes stop_codon:yes gene_type:complete
MIKNQTKHITLTDSNFHTSVDGTSTITINENYKNGLSYAFTVDSETAMSNKPPRKITIGKYKLTEEKLGKLLALLDVIENATESDIHNLLNMQSALNTIGGDNGSD